MVRKRLRAVAVLCAVAVAVGVTAAAPSGAAVPSQTQGVDKDSIEVVMIVPDLDALRSKGIDVGRGTNESFAQRFTTVAEEFGPINGRTLDVKIVGWDPIDVTSFEKACTQAVIDNEPFVVINASGYRDSSIPCITVDNDTPFMTGDMADATLQKASGKNLVTLGLPPEVAAKNAVRLLLETKQMPKSAKVGVLSNNIPGPKSAGDAVEKELKKRGVEVVEKVELNGLASDAGLIRREAGQAATTFQAQGADTVFNIQSLTQVQGMYDEMERAGIDFTVYSIDGQGNTCTTNASGRAPVAAEGLTCVTTWDTKALPTKDGVKPDNKLEASCREAFDAGTGKTTVPGGPSGGLLDANKNVVAEEDISGYECTIANLLLPAMKKAGKNLTWDKVHANLMATKSGPAAIMSNGQGSFGKNKPYWANQIHLTQLTRAALDTPASADGTYNGCPVPAPCWVPLVVNGKEWFPIQP